MGRRHLVALDGKEPSIKAFDWYLDNCNRPGDQVVVFHVSSFQLNIGLPGVAVNVDSVSQQVQDAKNKSENITQMATEKLKSRGIQGYVVAKSGNKPEDLLNQTVEEEKVDHVFLGTRDLGSIQRAFLGSVSTNVARTCKVPVTIVKG